MKFLAATFLKKTAKTFSKISPRFGCVSKIFCLNLLSGTTFISKGGYSALRFDTVQIACSFKNGCADFMGAWHFWALSAGKPPCP